MASSLRTEHSRATPQGEANESYSLTAQTAFVLGVGYERREPVHVVRSCSLGRRVLRFLREEHREVVPRPPGVRLAASRWDIRPRSRANSERGRTLCCCSGT